MTARAFFISEVWLKDNSPLSGNVGIEEIYPFAKTAEDVYIQEVIGTPLFNRLVASLTASPKDTNADETALLKLIRNALMWYTLYDAAPFFWVKMRNIGLVKQGGDNLETLSSSDMEKLRVEFMDKAKFYTKRLVDYLAVNRQKFASYSGPYTWADLYPNPSVSSNCDLAFDKNCRTNVSVLRKYFG